MGQYPIVSVSRRRTPDVRTTMVFRVRQISFGALSERRPKQSSDALCRANLLGIERPSVSHGVVGRRSLRLKDAIVWTIGCAVCGVLGCRPNQVELPEAQGEPKEEPGVTWVFHPLKKAPSRDRLVLPHKGVLEVDDAGGRWLVQPSHKPEPSPFGAAEALVGVRKSSSNYWALGASGTVYVFQQPLGTFTEVRTPPEPLSQATLAGEMVVAISEQGDTFFSSDHGRSWQKSKQDKFFVALAALESSGVLAYSVPEQWHLSRDGGQTFTDLALPSVAPDRVESFSDGRVFVRGMYDSFAWGGARLGWTSQPFPSVVAPNYELPPFARASAVAKHHAHLEGGTFRWLSTSAEAKPNDLRLLVGHLGNALSVQSLERPRECETFKMTARADTLFLVCQGREPTEVSPALSVYQGSVSKLGLKRREVKIRGKLTEVEIAAIDGTTLALSGVCPPSETEKGCAKRGILLSAGSGPSYVDLPGVLRAEKIAADSSGVLWALARREKDEHLLLFGPIRKGEQASPILDLTHRAELPGSSEVHALELLFGPDGVLSVVSSGASGIYLAAVDKEGTLLARGQAPPGASLVHGAGRFLAALDDERDRFWISRTGGLAWQKLDLPRSVCAPSREACEPHLVCSEVGCLVGDELTLIGWGKGAEGAPSELPLSAQSSAGAGSSRGLRCRAEGGWEQLEGLSSIPGVSDVALGQAAWVSVLTFPDRAAATSLVAPFTSATLKRTELLSPVADPSHFAFVVQPQVEGSAALRYRIPVNASAASEVQVEFEVAWDNQVEGITTQSRVSDSVGYGQLDFSTRQALTKKANPALLSVAERGLYLELESSGLSPGVSYYFSAGKPAERIPQVVWPAPGPLSEGWLRVPSPTAGSHERVHLAGEHGGLLRLLGGTVLVRYWNMPDHGWTFSPYRLGLFSDVPSESLQGTQIAYRGTRIGFVSMQVDPRTTRHRAHYVALGDEVAFEPPVAVPLLKDLPEKAPFCSIAQRQSTPRVLAPAPTGSKRAVTVTASTGAPLTLETESAVLFGTPKQPCVVAWQATSEAVAQTNARYRALVYPSPEQASWLFRMESDPLSGSRVAVRPMQCDYEESSP